MKEGLQIVPNYLLGIQMDRMVPGMSMAKDAIDILSDDARLKEMGERARASAQARFCASKIIPMYERHYRNVLERSTAKVG